MCLPTPWYDRYRDGLLAYGATLHAESAVELDGHAGRELAFAVPSDDGGTDHIPLRFVLRPGEPLMDGRLAYGSAQRPTSSGYPGWARQRLGPQPSETRQSEAQTPAGSQARPGRQSVDSSPVAPIRQRFEAVVAQRRSEQVAVQRFEAVTPLRRPSGSGPGGRP